MSEPVTPQLPQPPNGSELLPHCLTCTCHGKMAGRIVTK